MTGRRVPFRPGFPGSNARPGDYCRVPASADPRGACWYAVDPTGGAGAIVTHQVTVHEDGTISCSPSLVMPSGWHGFLERGVWREV
jgi:hypothetical protein